MTLCLIVDDTNFNRDVSKGIAEALGMEAMEAENVAQALVFCGDKMPDVIMLDWMMPEVDGIGFLKEFRLMEQGSKTYVILYSAGVIGDNAKETALMAGADAYFMLPIELAKIRETLTKAGIIS